MKQPSAVCSSVNQRQVQKTFSARDVCLGSFNDSSLHCHCLCWIPQWGTVCGWVAVAWTEFKLSPFKIFYNLFLATNFSVQVWPVFWEYKRISLQKVKAAFERTYTEPIPLLAGNFETVMYPVFFDYCCPDAKHSTKSDSATRMWLKSNLPCWCQHVAAVKKVTDSPWLASCLGTLLQQIHPLSITASHPSKMALAMSLHSSGQACATVQLPTSDISWTCVYSKWRLIRYWRKLAEQGCERL